MNKPKTFRILHSNGVVDTEYELFFRDHLMVIRGDSGSGKTLLLQTVRNGAKNGKNWVGIDQFSIMDGLVNFLKTKKDCLVVMDSCELYLQDRELDFIARDRNNYYVLFARNLDNKPQISLNLFGTFVRTRTETGYKITVKYNYNIRGAYH